MKLEPDKSLDGLPAADVALRSRPSLAVPNRNPRLRPLPSPALRAARLVLSLLALALLALSLAGHSLGFSLVEGIVWPAPRSERLSNAGADPLVRLDYGLFRGRSNGAVHSFYSIPFALPPVGALRFRPAQAIAPLDSPSLPPVTDAGEFGSSCYQQKQKDLPLVGPPWHLRPPVFHWPWARAKQGAQSQLNAQLNDPRAVLDSGAEDCLSLVVHGPAAEAGAELRKLPVVVWLFGGGFQIGAISQYDGVPIVSRSISEGTPIVYVAPNYRLNGFGFLAGRQVQSEGVGNLGLRDQQAALQWVQKYIHLFGGDPEQVTLWGESAGAMSASLHMLAPSSWGLFHRVWLNSGSPIPIRARQKGETDDRGQRYFDQLAAKTGCDGVPEGLRLGCLRRVPFEELREAIDDTPDLFAYQSLNLPWIPRVDGVFLNRSSIDLLEEGQVAPVPVVSGDCDDEGTLFSLSQTNITTSTQALTWIQHNYFPDLTPSELARLGQLYPSDPTKGSPFSTGYLNQLSPQFKRLAALQGDLVFQAPRRFFLSRIAERHEVWSFLYKRGKRTAYMGSFHGLELENEFYAPQVGATDFAFMDYLIAFIATGNPNSPSPARAARLDSHRVWPKWTSEERELLALVDRVTGPVGLPGTEVHWSGLQVERDDFREEQIEYLIELGTKYPM